MKKWIAIVLSLVLALSLGLPVASLGEAAEVSTLKLLVPENDPAALPWQMADISSGTVPHPVWDVFISWLAEKNLAIEFELVENSQYNVVSQTRLASGLDLPDIMNVRAISNSQLMSYANAGMLLPVSDIIEEYCSQETRDNINTKYPFYYGYTVNPMDGKSYTYGQLTAYLIDGEFKTHSITLKIRYDWLQKLNLEMPKTAQDLITIGKAFHEQDANGNGVTGDETFSVTANSFYCMGDYFGLVSFLLDGVLNDGQNKVVSPWYQDGIKDYFIFMNEMYNEGLINMDVSANQLNAENVLIGNYQYAYQAHLEAASPDPDCFYAPVDLLTGAEGIAPAARSDSVMLYMQNISFAVTNACTDPAAVGRLLDILFSDEYPELTSGGIEGVTFRYKEGSGNRYNGMNIDFVVPSNNVDAMRSAGLSNGYRLWGKGIFPNMSYLDLSSSYVEQIIKDYEDAGDWQNAFRYQKQMESYSYPLTTYTYGVFAMPTDEEAERKSELTTDLETYASELWSNLITGAASLDNWDSYIADMQAMGLDELIEIDQKLLDRWLEAVG